jgi:dTDP-4-dehydrorhamnose 3,5-epimerase
MMRVTRASIPDVLILEPKVFPDERGFFLETYNKKRYRDLGMVEEFVQDNLSFSRKGVLRGLHFQNPNAQGKLVYVLEGEVYDVVVDIRRGSPDFGKWFGIVLSAGNRKQLYIPTGFAHGFEVTSETALVAYKCTGFYAPDCGRCILWNDPAIGINWPIQKPDLAVRDANASPLAAIDPDLLPEYARD